MAKLAIRISLEPGALLLWLPEPTVIQRNAHLQASLHMEMGIGSKALIREDLVLGRYGETGGTFSTAWNISSWGKPLLRSTLSSEIPDFESCAVMGRFRSLRQIALVDTEPESLAVTDPPHIPTMFGLSTSQALCRLEEGGFVYQGLSEELMDLDAPARYIENFFIKMVQR
jgi:urease accessory protein